MRTTNRELDLILFRDMNECNYASVTGEENVIIPIECVLINALSVRII